MDNFTLQAMLLSQSLSMTATAYAISQSADKEKADDDAEKKEKKGGFKGFIKKLNPVRLFQKIFKKEKDKADDENEIGI